MLTTGTRTTTATTATAQQLEASQSPLKKHSPHTVTSSKPSWHALSSRLRAVRSHIYQILPQPPPPSTSFHFLPLGPGRSHAVVHASDTQIFLNRHPILASDTWDPLLRRAKFAPVHPLAAAWKRALSERQRRPVPSGIAILHCLTLPRRRQHSVNHLDTTCHHAAAIVFSIRATVFCAYLDSITASEQDLQATQPAEPGSFCASPLFSAHLPGAFDVKVVVPACSAAHLAPDHLTVVFVDATRHGGQLCSFDIALPCNTQPSTTHSNAIAPFDSSPTSTSAAQTHASSSASQSMYLWPSWLRPCPAPAPPSATPLPTPSHHPTTDAPIIAILTDCPSPPVAIPDYVSSEEFGRFTGYWPSPCGDLLLYTTIDANHIPLVHVGPDASVRYPRAGSRNVATHLHLFHLPTRRSVALCGLDAALAEWDSEYLTRAGWVDERMVWVQACTRDQCRLAVFVVPVEPYGLAGSVARVWQEDGFDGKWLPIHSTLAFLPRPASSAASDWLVRLIIASEQSGSMNLYLSSLCYSPSDPLQSPKIVRLTSGPPYTISRSEPLAILPMDAGQAADRHRVFFHATRVNPAGLAESALCSLDIDYPFDTTSQPPLISTWTPPGLHAHLVALCPGSLVLSTSSIHYSPQTVHIHTQLVDPNPAIPSSHVIARVAPPEPSPHSPDPSSVATLLCPRHYTFPSHSFPLSTFVWLPRTPPTSDAGYPTVLHVYAGPDVAAVTNDWYTARGGGAIVRVAALVELGFAVVVVDGRGSLHPERGAAWEAGLVRPNTGSVQVKVRATEHASQVREGEAPGAWTGPGMRGGPRADQVVASPPQVDDDVASSVFEEQAQNVAVDTVLGDGELSDQLDALTLLVESAGVPLDLARVAMVGWSYGGYLSLMGLAKHPHRVKMAVAGAPVTCWTQYDTAYSERFLGIPNLNCSLPLAGNALRVHAQFQASSVLAHVQMLPRDPNRLFLTQGQLDDNVHKSHHLDPFIDALVKAGVPHCVQLYPHERHGLRQVHTIEHFETQLLWWLTQYL